MSTEIQVTSKEIETLPVSKTTENVEDEGIIITTTTIDAKVNTDKQNETTTEVNTTREVTSTSTEDKQASIKRKNLFNNPFAKTSPKKDEALEIDETPKSNVDEEVTKNVATTSENKIAKSIGNIYSKIKQTASHNNIKDISGTSPPNVPVAVTTEGIVDNTNEVGNQITSSPSSSSSSSSNSSKKEENLHKSETPTTSGEHVNAKRQSFLSRLFWGNNNKKKEEPHQETAKQKEVVAHETENKQESTPNPEIDETRPSSPPLTRRVTGFFAKKLKNYNNSKKPKDKSEEAQTAVHETNDTPGASTSDDAPLTIAIIQEDKNDDLLTKGTLEEFPIVSEAATGATEDETKTDKNASSTVPASSSTVA